MLTFSKIIKNMFSHAYGFSRWVMDIFILELEISKLKIE
jgi:hypothetical protein